MINEETIIKVDNGDTFIGTLSDWRGCYFLNPTERKIRDWCKKYDFDVEFIQPSRSEADITQIS